MPPIHVAIRPNLVGNAAPSTAKIGNTPWVRICKTKVVYHETLPGEVPDSKLNTRSRFIEKYTNAQVPTVNNTKTQLNKTSRPWAGNGYELTANSIMITPAVAAKAKRLTCGSTWRKKSATRAAI